MLDLPLGSGFTLKADSNLESLKVSVAICSALDHFHFVMCPFYSCIYDSKARIILNGFTPLDNRFGYRTNRSSR